MYNFSRFNLFYLIISCSGHKRGKEVKNTENSVTVLLCGSKYVTCSGSCRCQRALPVCRPRVLPLLRCGVHELSVFCFL